MTAAVEVSGLDKVVAVGFWGRRRQLLDSVSFTVAAQHTVGFVGVNGAGKSTTLKHLIGGSRPTRGTVRVFGADPRAPTVRKRFGYMPEQPWLPPTLTPREMMRLHATLSGMSPSSPRIDALLDAVGLAERATERVGTFSKGMQTRLTLALALLPEPELLILDEPMSGLDPVGRQLVRRILREQAQQGRTILFSSHVLSDVEALCSDVIVINAGKIVYSGSASAALGEATGGWTVRVGSATTAPQGEGIREARREGDTWLLSVNAATGEEAARRGTATGGTLLSLEPERPSLENRLLEIIGKSSS